MNRVFGLMAVSSFAVFAISGCVVTTKPVTTTATVTTDPTGTPPPATTTAPPPPPPPVTTTAPPPPPPAYVDERWSVADGVPVGLRSGAPVSYWVWHTPGTNLWHVRTTTAARTYRFTGYVETEGPIYAGKTHGLESNDYVRQDGANKIVFNMQTTGAADGFDFKIAGNRCVRFHMLIDGKSAPNYIKIGRNGVHPRSWHFRLCP